jgi:hypothetical protein
MKLGFNFAVVMLMLVAQGAGAACSRATVQGAYSWSGEVDSFDLVADGFNSSPLYTVGRLVFDGKGKITLRSTKISAIGRVFTINGNGTYNLAANCIGTGRLNITSPDGLATRLQLNFAVSGTAKVPEIDMLYTDVAGAAESGLISLKKMRL